MKRLLAFACFSVALQGHATLDFYDSFNYSPTDVQLSQAAQTNWVAYTGGTFNPTNTAGSLGYPGLLTASGDNSVLFNGTGASGITARNLSQLYNINVATTLYYSLTFKVLTINTGDWGGSANFLTGSFMMGFNQKLRNGTALATTDAGAPLLIRTGDPTNTSGTANDFQGYQLGTGTTAVSPTARIFDSTHTYSPGDTLFLVLSYSFSYDNDVAGSFAAVAKLYVNPTPGSLETANTPVVMSTNNPVSNNQVQSFFLRNNSVEPANTQIDDLRVGTTWEDVTPIPEPSAIALAAVGCGTTAIRLNRRELRKRRRISTRALKSKGARKS
jgi:hypothetical protein